MGPKKKTRPNHSGAVNPKEIRGGPGTQGRAGEDTNGTPGPPVGTRSLPAPHWRVLLLFWATCRAMNPSGPPLNTPDNFLLGLQLSSRLWDPRRKHFPTVVPSDLVRCCHRDAPAGEGNARSHAPKSPRKHPGRYHEGTARTQGNLDIRGGPGPPQAIRGSPSTQGRPRDDTGDSGGTTLRHDI